MENPSELNESEKTYRALENSIHKIQRFTHKLAKKSNPSLEVQGFWELGDPSLIHWISDTHCYLSRRGQKLQFLGRQSKLEIIGFHLEEGDKLLICGESIREKITDAEIDEILQGSNGVKDSCLNILKVANKDTPYNVYNVHNVIVLEVVNKQKIAPSNVDANNNPFIKKSYDGLFFLILFLGIVGVLAYFYNSNRTFDISGLVNKVLKRESPQNTNTPTDSLQSFQSNTDSLTQSTQPSISNDGFGNEPSNSFQENTTKPVETSTEATTTKSVNTQPLTAEKVAPKSTWKKPEATVSKKPNSADFSKEEQNYNALRQQKEKWLKIRNDLQQKLNAGDASVTDQLNNSIKVLARIEEKLMVSAQKLDSQR